MFQNGYSYSQLALIGLLLLLLFTGSDVAAAAVVAVIDRCCCCCDIYSLLGICLRLRWARETWARRIFQRLCDQFCVATAVELAAVLLACMEENNSIVYIGFNLQVKRAYYGMVHERSPHERWQEHWRAVMQHSAGIASETEKKYTYMASHGGAASWLFLYPTYRVGRWCLCTGCKTCRGRSSPYTLTH